MSDAYATLTSAARPRTVVLMAYDDNEDYRAYRPLVEQCWKRMGFDPVFVHVTKGQPDKDSLQIKPPEGVDSAAMAKFSRLLQAGHRMFQGCRVVLSDLDMVPLNRQFFEQAVYSLPPNQFGASCGDGYNVGNYFASCYCIADRAVWAEILAPLNGHVPQWMMGHNSSSDEALLKILLDAWGQPGRTAIGIRGWWLTSSQWSSHQGIHSAKWIAHRRLEKSVWAFDERGLRAGEYIDAHLPPHSKIDKRQLAIIEEVALAG
jgi:hypothetical protein